MTNLVLFKDGWHVGPLFQISKKRPLVRPHGKQGIVHRAQTKRRTPPWSDLDVIKVYYRKAKRLSQWTGDLYVVDHIVPKCGGIVSGLHVPWNLQILHWRVNAVKGAGSWPDMPMEQLTLF